MTKDDFLWLFDNVRDTGEPEGYSIGKEVNGTLFIIDRNCGIKYRLVKGEVEEMQVDSKKDFHFESMIAKCDYSHFESMVAECDYSQLQKLTEMCKTEMNKRDEKRFNELVKNVLDAIHALKTEYPFASWTVSIGHDDCDTDIDLLNINRSMSDFSR